MKLLLPVFFCLTLLLAAGTQAQPIVVSDPLRSYYHRLVADASTGNVDVVEADFDCDGRLDLALTDSLQGHAGAGWFIALRRSDGRYAQVGVVITKANRFHITRQKRGLGRLAVMVRGGPGDLLITYYDVSQTALRKLREERVLIPQEQTGRNHIDDVFGRGYSELPATRYSFSQLQARYSR